MLRILFRDMELHAQRSQFIGDFFQLPAFVNGQVAGVVTVASFTIKQINGVIKLAFQSFNFFERIHTVNVSECGEKSKEN